jgi:ssDNA-binding protein
MSNKSTKVITSICTLSYPHLDKPQKGQKESDEPKYSAALVFTPEHQATPEGKACIAALQEAAIAAATDKFGASWTLPTGVVISIADALREQVLSSPFRKDALAKGYPAGSLFLNVRSAKQPGTVYAHAGNDGKPEKVPQDKIVEVFYAGAQVRVSLAAFGYNHGVKKGVSFGLNNIQKIAEGPRFDSRVAAEDDFSVDLSQAPADLNSLV